MNVIKELWHGNIVPQEDSRTNSKEMKELLGYARRDNPKRCDKRHQPPNARKEDYHHRAKGQAENQNSTECRLLHAHRLPARRERSDV